MERTDFDAQSAATGESFAERPSVQLFPVFLDLSDKQVMIVGGGVVAKRKIDALLSSGARILVVAPELDSSLQSLRESGRITHIPARYAADQLDGVWLVIAATCDRAVNAQVFQDASAKRLFVNVVDDAPHSNFQSPARVERGPLQIAISSGGVAPMLARHVREQLEAQFDPAYASLARLFESERHHIRSALPNANLRRAFFEQVLSGNVMHSLRNHRLDLASSELHEVLSSFQSNDAEPSKRGRVILVGAGPGDPGLLSLRALRVLNLADVILTDQLVSKEVLGLARRDAEVIDVGKFGSATVCGGLLKRTEQSVIHALMLEHARLGKCVVRLKGGDAFIFGRGGEELEFLHAHGVAFEVVPGITAALACAAYSGVPLTHRDMAQSVRFVTAHCQSSLDNLDWIALAEERQTLAVYMGVARLQMFQDQLLTHGRAPTTPIAIVENGSRPTQRVLQTQLATLAQDAKTHAIQAPSLMIVGEVASLASQHHWFGELISTRKLDAQSLADKATRQAFGAGCFAEAKQVSPIRRNGRQVATETASENFVEKALELAS
jgi:uroporphyrin-III C-methyltransferase / precorrin-2 dehydrogenase / sirohydrochlorin ferrochelatase